MVHFADKWWIHGEFSIVQRGPVRRPFIAVTLCACSTIMSTNLKRAIERSNIIPYSTGRYDLHISHLFYADDVLIFTNGFARSLNHFMALIRSYELSSGQQVNKQKSIFYLGAKAERRRDAIAQITRLNRREFPLMYLGFPIFYGRAKAIFYQHLVDKLIRGLEGWKAWILSFRAKLTLIKYVLSNIPIYTLSSTLVTASIIKRIEGLMATFLWYSHGEKRTHWVT